MIGRIRRIFAACREVRQIPVGRQVCGTLLLLLFGIVSGVFAKFLDTTPANVLPRVLEVLDIRNVLGRFAVWELTALCIAVYSSRALRASLNVFVFFAGMLAGYYVYTAAAGEIVSVSYVMVWVGFTLLSLPLAALCWYAKGACGLSFALSAVILAFLFWSSFVYGIWYFAALSLPEALAFGCGAVVLRRKTLKMTALLLACGIALGLILGLLIPFSFG